MSIISLQVKEKCHPSNLVLNFRNLVDHSLFAMSQWLSLNQLCRKNRQVQERVNEHFNRINFPYKIRSTFAEWIEAKEWSVVVRKKVVCEKKSYLFSVT